MINVNLRYVTLLALIGAVLLVNCAYSHNSTIEDRNPSWQEIYGLHYRGGKIFIDGNSLLTETINGRTINYGRILVVATEPTEIQNDSKKFTAKSLVKTVVIDCDSGQLIPVEDFFFDVEKPSNFDKPLGKFEYKFTPKESKVVDRGSPLHSALCPIWT